MQAPDLNKTRGKGDFMYFVHWDVLSPADHYQRLVEESEVKMSISAIPRNTVVINNTNQNPNTEVFQYTTWRTREQPATAVQSWYYGNKQKQDSNTEHGMEVQDYYQDMEYQIRYKQDSNENFEYQVNFKRNKNHKNNPTNKTITSKKRTITKKTYLKENSKDREKIATKSAGSY